VTYQRRRGVRRGRLRVRKGGDSGGAGQWFILEEADLGESDYGSLAWKGFKCRGGEGRTGRRVYLGKLLSQITCISIIMHRPSLSPFLELETDYTQPKDPSFIRHNNHHFTSLVNHIIHQLYIPLQYQVSCLRGRREPRKMEEGARRRRKTKK